MEPLSILSVAASIVQFIDFGTRLVCEAKEIADYGSSVSVQDLTTITSDLSSISVSLRQQLDDKLASASNLTNDEKALYELTKQCDVKAQDLIKCLDKVMVKHVRRGQTWANVQAALKTVWSKRQIDTLVQKLGDYRGQLSLRVVLLLNTRIQSQDLTLGELHKSSKDIVEVLSLNDGSLKSAIAGIRQDLRQNRKVVDETHKEAMAAILTMRDGSSRTIAGSLYTHESFATSDTTSMGPATNTATLYIHDDLDTNDPTALRGNLQRTTTRILNALHFQKISDRECSIDKAHEKTYQWVFDQSSSTREWDSLPVWLKSGSGCYWVNGKAGSGKSTLMKYLSVRNETRQLLHEWADSSTLVTASFYFWYAGTSLQKSQSGLLRSLLLTVLSQKPYLAPILFPAVFRACFAGQAQETIEFSYEELKQALTILVNSTPPGLKVCFFVDGLDEYDGNSNELSDLFTSFATSEFVKILLSSRPVPACVEAFSPCPKLRLQDLTRADIELYVGDKLATHSLMKKLSAVETGATAHLVQEVTSKAEGVFLWVILFVRRLLTGLQDYDTLADLLQKLDELPPSLEKLYHHMLESMSPLYRRQGSKLLQLIIRSMETHGDWPMTVLQLSFAEDEDYAGATAPEISELSPELEILKCEAIEGRMRSRCCGLVQVQAQETSWQWSTKVENPVGFSHKTVADFLRIDSVWKHLIGMTEGTAFDVDRALFNSSLLEMRAKPSSPWRDPHLSVAYRSMLRIITYSRRMETNGKACLAIYFGSLVQTMFDHWRKGSLAKSLKMNMPDVVASTLQCCARFSLSEDEKFLTYAAIACNERIVWSLIFDLYPEHDANCNRERNRIRARLAVYLFKHSMEGERGLSSISSKDTAWCNSGLNDVLPSTLKRETTGNLYWLDSCFGNGETVGYIFLEHANYLIQDPKSLREWILTDFRDHFLDLIKHMVDADETDLDRRIHFAPLDSIPWECPRALLSDFLSKLWETRALITEQLSHKEQSTIAAKSRSALAERAHKISQRVESAPMANRWLQDLVRKVPEVSRPTRSHSKRGEEPKVPWRTDFRKSSTMKDVVSMSRVLAPTTRLPRTLHSPGRLGSKSTRK